MQMPESELTSPKQDYKLSEGIYKSLKNLAGITYERAMDLKDNIDGRLENFQVRVDVFIDELTDIVKDAAAVAKNPRATIPLLTMLGAYACSDQNYEGSAYRQRLVDEEIKPHVLNSGHEFDPSKVEFRSAIPYGEKDSVFEVHYSGEVMWPFARYMVPEDTNKPIKPIKP